MGLMLWSDFKATVEQYAQGKRWYWYAPFWLIGAYAFIELVQFDLNKPALILLIPQSFDFFLHEMAHIVTAWLPPILTASAGSLSELLLGTLLVLGALKGRAYFALLICCLWFMLACQSAGVYMADARAQRLPLVSLGAALSGSSEVTHDWHFVFGQLHILPFDILIGDGVRAVGAIVGALGLLGTLWIMYLMAAAQGAEREAAKRQELQAIIASHAERPEGSEQPTSEIYPAVSKGPLADAPKHSPAYRDPRG